MNVLRIVSGSALPRGPAPCSLSAQPGGGGRAPRAPLARFSAPSALESGGVDSLAETPTEVGVPKARKRAPGALSPGLRLSDPEGPTGSRRCLSRFVPPSPFLRPRRFAPPDGAEAPPVRATNRAAIHSCSGFPQQRSWGSRALQGFSRFPRTPPLPASSSPLGLLRAGPASAVAFACTVAPDLQGFALSVSRSWRGASRSSLRGVEPKLVSAAPDRSPPLNRPWSLAFGFPRARTRTLMGFCLGGTRSARRWVGPVTCSELSMSSEGRAEAELPVRAGYAKAPPVRSDARAETRTSGQLAPHRGALPADDKDTMQRLGRGQGASEVVCLARVKIPLKRWFARELPFTSSPVHRRRELAAFAEPLKTTRLEVASKGMRRGCCC